MPRKGKRPPNCQCDHRTASDTQAALTRRPEIVSDEQQAQASRSPTPIQTMMCAPWPQIRKNCATQDRSRDMAGALEETVAGRHRIGADPLRQFGLRHMGHDRRVDEAVRDADETRRAGDDQPTVPIMSVADADRRPISPIMHQADAAHDGAPEQDRFAVAWSDRPAATHSRSPP